MLQLPLSIAAFADFQILYYEAIKMMKNAWYVCELIELI